VTLPQLWWPSQLSHTGSTQPLRLPWHHQVLAPRPCWRLCVSSSTTPIGPHATPSAAEQWHQYVDQLIITTINTPPHGGRQANHSGGVLVPSTVHLCSPTAPRAPLVARAASLAMADLRAKLEQRCSGKDDCITIEHRREWRRNLDGDFSATDTTPMKQASRTPTSSGFGGGCMTLAHTSA
jgi:hypothetical protein